nr:uncharacterized protein LOC111422081 [Onthophagus taurus]
MFTSYFIENSTSPAPTTVGGSNNTLSQQSLDTIANLFVGIITAIRNFVSFLANQVAPPVIEFFQNILTLVKQISSLVKIFVGLGGINGDVVFNAIDTIVSIISTVLTLISNVIKAIGSAVSKRSLDINSLYDNLNSTVQSYLTQIEGENQKLIKDQHTKHHHYVHNIHKKVHHR